MSCEPTRNWLMNADAPAAVETVSPEVAAHLDACTACRGLQDNLVKLEREWRGRPLPARAEAAKAAFLDRLQNPPAPVQPARARRHWSATHRWAVAALLFIGVGMGTLLFLPGQEATAHPDVLDQLIDWNLEMSEAPSADRQGLYDNKHASLKKRLDSAKLAPTDRALAEELLQNGSWLAKNEDPVEELNRFSDMADHLLERVNTAAADTGRAGNFARRFRKVNERAIDRNMERVSAITTSDPERQRLINKALKQDADRADQIQNILQNSPDISKKELRKALELNHKRHKKKI